MTFGALSQIENNKTSPSVSTLKKILNALDVTLAEFFTDNEPPANTSCFVFRQSQLLDVARRPGLNYWTLPRTIDPRQLQIMHEIYAPNASTGEELYTHDGDEGGICVAGTMN